MSRADVVVFHLMADEAVGQRSLPKLVMDSGGRRPAHAESQVWVGVSYEASDWAVDKAFVHSERGAAVFDYLFVHENRNMLQLWGVAPRADSPPFAERTHDALLLVSNCGPTPVADGARAHASLKRLGPKRETTLHSYAHLP